MWGIVRHLGVIGDALMACVTFLLALIVVSLDNRQIKTEQCHGVGLLMAFILLRMAAYIIHTATAWVHVETAEGILSLATGIVGIFMLVSLSRWSSRIRIVIEEKQIMSDRDTVRSLLTRLQQAARRHFRHEP